MSQPPESSTSPRRVVHCTDAIPWLEAAELPADSAVVTSLPDVSELRLGVDAWRAWFLRAVDLVVRRVPAQGVALFFQSDIRHEGRWLDKGAWVVRAAEDAGAHVLLHAIVCRREPGRPSGGRPGYTHLIGVSRERRCTGAMTMPDVLLRPGRQPWVRAMGVRAAAEAVRFARDHAGARIIVDPFCGVGTVLAVANALGLDAIGVERSVRRAELSRTLNVAKDEIH